MKFSLWTKYCFQILFSQFCSKLLTLNKINNMLKFSLILSLNLLNIFSFVEAFVELPTVKSSVKSLQNEFNALMKKKSCPSCFREYFQKFSYSEYLQIIYIFCRYFERKAKNRRENCLKFTKNKYGNLQGNLRNVPRKCEKNL